MIKDAFGEETDLIAAGDPVLQAIQEAAVHIISAQSIWRQRWQGISPIAPLDATEYPTPLAIKFAFGAERARFWGYFETLATDEALVRVVDFKTLDGTPYSEPLWHMMQHVVNHGSYHRGQITGRLLDRGLEPVLLSTDLITYYRSLV